MKYLHKQKANNIAVYWDFENIHISLCRSHYGDIWCGKADKKEAQPAIMDVDSIMEFITSIGIVNINRAYANWTYFYSYNEPLQNHSIDLIQLFPRTRAGKNGSDIRMSIDIIEDLVQSSHIDTVVLIGGDSDYIAVSQKVRQMGKQIIGIGLQETTSPFFVKSCNEFKYYSSLLVRSSSQQPELTEESFEDIGEAKDLLRKAITTLTESSGSPKVVKAAIKPMLIRLEPTFDEGNYGFSTFTSLMDACSDIIDTEKGEYDILVSLKDTNAPTQIATVSKYEKILRDQGIRLVPHGLMAAAFTCTVEIFQAHGQIESYTHYKKLLGDCLTAKGVGFEPSDLTKIKAIIFKAFLFKLDYQNKSIELKHEYKSHHHLFVEILDFLVKRIVYNSTSDVDSAEIAQLLLGDAKQKDHIEKLIKKLAKDCD